MPSTAGKRGNKPAGKRREPSPLAEALASVGDRWTLLVVEALLVGPRRFKDLLAEIEGIAPNVLSQRLRHLEHQQIVVAQLYSERPPRSLYELTPAGRDLAGAMRLLSDWGARHGASGGEGPRHRPCGTPLEPRWYCPTCEETVAEGDREDEDLHFL